MAKTKLERIPMSLAELLKRNHEKQKIKLGFPISRVKASEIFVINHVKMEQKLKNPGLIIELGGKKKRK